MSEKGKPAPRVAPPPEDLKEKRSPSPREREWEEKTLRPTLEKSPEREPKATTSGKLSPA